MLEYIGMFLSHIYKTIEYMAVTGFEMPPLSFEAIESLLFHMANMFSLYFAALILH